LYLPGLKNVAADFLSRPPTQTAGSFATTTVADPVDYEEMAAEQHRCPGNAAVAWRHIPQTGFPPDRRSTLACANALTFSWISCFGIPETITSDHGPQFTSNLWFKLC
jgi:hypothetical protein